MRRGQPARAVHQTANAVHDDVLTVLRAVSLADPQVPWSLVVSKARHAQDALAWQMPRKGHRRADPRSGLGSVAGSAVAAAMLAAFRRLSSRTESQLAEYRDRLRRQARAEAISRVDNAALDHARRVAGPVLDAVISSPAPDPDLRIAAALASATLRDELLAPGFLTPPLADRVRVTRMAGANITIDVARQPETRLVQAARELLAAALAGLDAGSRATLQVHPSARERPALLILHVRSRQSDHVALRRHAAECDALISDLGDHEILVRLRARPEAS
jgi:hypothetical protein